MAEQTAALARLTEEELESELMSHLEAQTGVPVEADRDLFASGLFSSLFAMQLVVHLEKTYGVTIGGADLRLDNFRSAWAMSQLVLRLRGESADGAHNAPGALGSLDGDG